MVGLREQQNRASSGAPVHPASPARRLEGPQPRGPFSRTSDNRLRCYAVTSSEEGRKSGRNPGLSRRQRGGMIRPVAAQMLCKYAGLNQRAVAGVLNLKSGGAVGCQIRKFFKVLAEDETLKSEVEKISEKLDNERRK